MREKHRPLRLSGHLPFTVFGRRKTKAQERSREALGKQLSTALGEGGLGQASACTVRPGPLIPGAAEDSHRVSCRPTAPPSPWHRRALMKKAFNHSVLAGKWRCWKFSSTELSRNTLRPPRSHPFCTRGFATRPRQLCSSPHSSC